jgi:hypothetical protein
MSIRTKQALHDGECSWCDREVIAGDQLFPVLETTCQLSQAAAAAQKSAFANTSTAAARRTTGTMPLTCQPVSSSTTTTVSGRKSVWLHVECAKQVFQYLERPVEPPICRHWLRLGRCPFGSDCFFLHPPLSSPVSAVSVNHHSEQVHMLQPERRTWGGRRKKLFKPTASIFRAWLLTTFGHDYLLGSSNKSSSGGSCGGVLDVAGGKGELAFELENLSGIRTHVVDPRPLTLRRAFLKWKSGHYEKAASNPILGRYLTHYNQQVVPSYPGHLRVFFNEHLIERFTTYHSSHYSDNSIPGKKKVQCQLAKDWWEQCRDYAQQQAWTRKGLESATTDKLSDPENGSSASRNCEDEGELEMVKDTQLESWLSNAPCDVADVDQALKILSNCSAVLGLHPDQATEACVDFALATNKPFAVVPCCVFSSLFRNRRMKDGSPVKTTSQLIQYLMEKEERIQVDTLGFEGMNRVVYLTPEQCQRI